MQLRKGRWDNSWGMSGSIAGGSWGLRGQAYYCRQGMQLSQASLSHGSGCVVGLPAALCFFLPKEEIPVCVDSEHLLMHASENQEAHIQQCRGHSNNLHCFHNAVTSRVPLRQAAR
jgi:hypothetical protein